MLAIFIVVIYTYPIKHYCGIALGILNDAASSYLGETVNATVLIFDLETKKTLLISSEGFCMYEVTILPVYGLMHFW